jgi:hypothetical protein
MRERVLSVSAVLIAATLACVTASAQELPQLPPPEPAPQPLPAPIVQPAPQTTIAPSPEKRPSTGTALIITGAVLLGVGVVNLATSPLCKSDAIIRDKKIQDVCFGAALVVGGVMVAVGVPLLIVGLGKHSTYNEWKKRNPGLAGLDVRVGESGGGLSYGIEF